MKTLDDVKKEILNSRKIDINTLKSIVADVVDYNPNCDDYKYFEVGHLHIQSRDIYYFYTCSTMVPLVEFHNYIWIEDNRLWVYDYFIKKCNQHKYEDGDMNEELNFLIWLNQEQIEITGI